MKKLFTASLVAMMAVSAANADIASTKYVTDRTGNTTFTGSVSTAADLTAAVNALAGKVDTVAGNGSGSVSDQIASALENYDNSGEVDTKISNATDTLQANIDKKQDIANIYTDADTPLAGVDATTKYPSVSYVDAKVASINSGLSGVNNSITEINSALDTLGALADESMVTTAFITDKNVTKAKLADDVQASLGKADNSVQTSTYNTDKSATDAAIAALQAADTQIAKDYADADSALKSELEGKIAEAKTEASYDDTEVRGLISDNAGEISTIKGEQTTQNSAITALQTSLAAGGSTAQAIADAKKAGTDAAAAAATADGKAVAAQAAADAAQDAADAAQAAADAAQGEVDVLEGVVAQNKTDAEKYIDATELTEAQTEQDTTLKAYADQAASAAETAAKAFTTQEMNALTALATFPVECSVEQCALTNDGTSLKWEVVR